MTGRTVWLATTALGSLVAMTALGGCSGAVDSLAGSHDVGSSDASPGATGLDGACCRDANVAHSRDASLGEDASSEGDGDAPSDGGASSDGDASSGGDASSDGDAPSDTGAPTGDAAPDVDGSARTDQWIWNSHIPAAASFNGVWGSGPNDAWVVGDGGLILHWNGSLWTAVSSGTNNHLQSVWGASANNVWAVAGGIDQAPNMVHWDGKTWSAVDAGTTTNLSGLWGTGPNDVWTTSTLEVLHFDGHTWSSSFTNQTTNLAAIWGTGQNDVWAVGSPNGPIADNAQESIFHLNGSWSAVADNATSAQAKVLTSVWSAASNDAWAVGYGNILHYGGTKWSPLTDADLLKKWWSGVWGQTTGRVWAVDLNADVARWNGASWTVRSLGVGSLRAVGGDSTAVAGEGQGVWAVGANVIFSFVPDVQGPIDCARVGGACGDASACAAGTGHITDYSCASSAQVCCVVPPACVGTSEPTCCDSSHQVIASERPICHNGNFVCTTGAICVPPPSPP